MSKIMELAQAYATACTTLKLGAVADSWVALQTEVTRMEAELAEAKGDYKILQGHYSLAVLERNALSNNLAALEAQQPDAWMRQWSFNGDETSFELYGLHGDCQKDAAYYGGICAPLYLGAGAKEKP